MKLDVRYANHPDDSKKYDTELLRHHYLIEKVFEPDDILLTYSHQDRIIAGGIMPVNMTLKLEGSSEMRAKYFLERREMGFINQHYIISDGNNKIVNYINILNHCCSSEYSFLDSNKNREGVVNVKNGFYITYEEFDNYNTRISTADLPLIHNGDPTLNEYDQYGNIAFKTKTMFIRRNRILKIFDSNGIEVNLNNKSLLNKGFTKIQMIYIINNIFI
jgi:hypothetical protein